MSYKLLYQILKTNKIIYLFISEYIYKFYRQKNLFCTNYINYSKIGITFSIFPKVILLEFKLV